MTEHCSHTGKVTYLSKGLATRQIRHMQREDGRRKIKMRSLNAYECWYCKRWHIGNRPKERKL